MAPRVKNYCFTSYEVFALPFLGLMDQISYLVYGREECPTTKKRHLQGFVSFKNRQSFGVLKKCEQTFHLETMKGTYKEAADYCKKDGDYIEFGTLPDEKIANLGIKQAIQLAKNGDREGLLDKHSALYIRYKRSFDTLVDFKPVDNSDSCGVWIVGPPRTGKDYAIRLLKNYFNKPLNKWWDGYEGQANVLISDLDQNHGSWIGHFLKIWFDRYVFTAEIKGGTIKIRPKNIFVTSNFEIDEIFTDPKMSNAIKVRCNIIRIDDNKQLHFENRPQFESSDRVFKALIKYKVITEEDYDVNILNESTEININAPSTSK